MEGFSEEELRRQILNFLKDFKELMGQGHYYVKEHHKNIQSLRDLGITARIRDEIILSVAMEDYSSGPNPDEYHPGHYWIFGKALMQLRFTSNLRLLLTTTGMNELFVIHSILRNTL